MTSKPLFAHRALLDAVDGVPLAASVTPTVRSAPGLRVMDVDPATAARMLLRNHANRPHRPTEFKAYKADMLAGRWRYTGEPIRFGKSGRLIDGQHRLRAIVETGVTLRLLVVSDIEDSAFDVIDTGARRTLSDVLVIEGYEPWVAKTGASAANIAMPISLGLVPGAFSAPNHIARQYILDNPDLMSSVQYLGAMPRTGVPMTHTVGSALHMFMNRLDPDLAQRFFRGLFFGDGLDATDTLLQLRNRLIARTISRTINRRESMAATIRVWNGVRIGRPLRHIGNAFRADVFPEIK